MAIYEDFSFGQRVRELREQMEWSQERLATEAGIRISHLSKIEREEYEDVHLSTALKICNAFDMSFDKLVKRTQ